MRIRRRAVSLFTAAAALTCALLAGCSASVASCPSNAQTLALYTITYTAVDGGDTCLVTSLPDGGPANSNLVATPASNTAHLCATGADGGTPQLFLDSTALTSTDQKTFTAGGSESDVSGSACVCPLDVTNALSLTLTTADGGPLAYDQDAGFNTPASFTGTFSYAFSPTASTGVACHCNVPCGAHYTIAGTH